MDVFFECMPIKEKRRVHFNSFMLEFHNRRFRNKFEKKFIMLYNFFKRYA